MAEPVEVQVSADVNEIEDGLWEARWGEFTATGPTELAAAAALRLEVQTLLQRLLNNPKTSHQVAAIIRNLSDHGDSA